MFKLWHVVGHHWHSGMGGGVHPTKCMGVAKRKMTALLKQFQQA
jgi:hypothetical protein